VDVGSSGGAGVSLVGMAVTAAVCFVGGFTMESMSLQRASIQPLVSVKDAMKGLSPILK